MDVEKVLFGTVLLDMAHSYRNILLLVDFVHPITDVLTLKHYVTGACSASGVRQEAANLSDPSDQDCICVLHTIVKTLQS